MSASVSIVVIDEQGDKVYLYQHYDGYEISDLLKKSLDRGRSTWNDGPYLARIIFSDMIRDDIDGETGYGISTSPMCDNEYMVDVRDHSIIFPDNSIKTFDEFVKE